VTSVIRPEAESYILIRTRHLIILYFFGFEYNANNGLLGFFRSDGVQRVASNVLNKGSFG
jgi:hypothetical protein